MASEALRKGKETIVISDQYRQDLITLNRSSELLLSDWVDHAVKVAAITRSSLRRCCQPIFLQKDVVQQVRIDRIKQAQDEENWIFSLKIYLVGDVARLSAAEAKVCALVAPDYEVDQSGLLFFCPRSATELEDRTELARLVVPEQLQQAFLHHYHTS